MNCFAWLWSIRSSFKLRILKIQRFESVNLLFGHPVCWTSLCFHYCKSRPSSTLLYYWISEFISLSIFFSFYLLANMVSYKSKVQYIFFQIFKHTFGFSTASSMKTYNNMKTTGLIDKVHSRDLQNQTREICVDECVSFAKCFFSEFKDDMLYTKNGNCTIYFSSFEYFPFIYYLINSTTNNTITVKQPADSCKQNIREKNHV